MLICYDLAQHTVLRAIECAAPLTTLALSADGVQLAVGTEDGDILCYDVRAMQQATMRSHPPSPSHPPYRKVRLPCYHPAAPTCPSPHMRGHMPLE